MRGRAGFSLVETLVVVAIIGILMAMYLPALSKAIRQAEKVATTEGMRQDNIGRRSDGPSFGERPPRESCRAAYRRSIGRGSARTNEIFVTEMQYIVRNEAEFRAYWFTLIDPEATEPLEYTRHDELIAHDDEGTEFLLSPRREQLTRGETFPASWEFLSSVPSEGSGDIGTTVNYSDTHVRYCRYPGEYPACRSVAELSHRFMQAYGG